MASPKSSPSSSPSPPEELSVVRVLDSSEPLVTNSSLVPSVQVLSSSESLVRVPEPIVGYSAAISPVDAAATSDQDLDTEQQPSGSSGRRIQLYAEEVRAQWNLRKVFNTFNTVENCVTFATARGMIPTNKLCSYHRSPMALSRTTHQLGTFRCRKSNCRNSKISQAAGTWFESAHLPLTIIFELMYMFANNFTYEEVRRETASEDRDTVLSFRTIADWFSYCREAVVVYEIEKEEERPMIGGPGKIVQIDESKFGKRKYNRGRQIEGHWIIGMIEDGSDDLRLEVCPNNERSADILIPLIKKHVREGSIIHTDYWRAYDCLPEHGYIHKKVNHSDPQNRFVAPDGTHTQRIESHWRGLKRQFHMCNFKGNFEDWVVENNWRRKIKISHKDLFEELLNVICYVYKI